MMQFWATWCASCGEEIRNLDLLYRHYRDRGLVVVGVGIDDSTEELRKFRDTYHIEMPILVDSEQTVKGMFHLMGLPVMQVLDRSGRIATVEDPKTREFTERISGARQWGSPAGIASLERLLRMSERR